MADNWSTPAFELPPVGARIGPFMSRTWLKTWWNHRGRGDLILAEADESLLPLVVDNGVVEFAGEADLTDYHSPLGSPDAPALDAAMPDLRAGSLLRFDSLPAEAAAGITAALRRAEISPSIEEHTVTAVLHLPESFDEYLAALAKKERHELRRKRRRFDNEAGPARVERRSGSDAVALFARLHRLSAGDKGAFMSEKMEAFFLELHEEAGGVIDMLVTDSGRVASAIFSFEDASGYYLYNSAFEPELQHLSPGNVMLSHLIERAIEQGKIVFDFLKGDERYKFKLGAEARPLYLITAKVPS